MTLDLVNQPKFLRFQPLGAVPRQLLTFSNEQGKESHSLKSRSGTFPPILLKTSFEQNILGHCIKFQFCWASVGPAGHPCEFAMLREGEVATFDGE